MPQENQGQIPQADSDQHPLISRTQTASQKTAKKTTISPDWKDKWPDGIEKPLASARPNESAPSYSESNSSSSHDIESFLNPSQSGVYKELENNYQRHKAEIDYKYSSVHNLDEDNKIKALKNIHLNPYKLDSAYDGLSNSMERWKSVAKDAASKNYTPEQKNKIAENYYNKMIAPLYAKLGTNPMSKDAWMKAAYGQALEYKIEDAYNSSITHGLLHGWDSGTAAFARAGTFVTNVAGEAMKDGVALWREKEKLSASIGHGGVGWHEMLKDIHNAVSTDDKHWIDKASEDTKKIPVLNRVTAGTEYINSRMQFSSDMYPNRNWLGSATSFVSEQAAQLPVYLALSAVAPLEGANLTKALTVTKIGKLAYGSLMAGGEGLAYGALTRQQEDKGQAWRDAVGFAVFHGLFSIGGMGLQKLVDILPDGKSLDALKLKQDKLELASKGLRQATGEERYAAHKKEVANNLAVVGIPGQRAIYAEALKHVADMENRGLTKAQIKEHERALLSSDPARFSPVFSAASYIRALLGDTRLGTIKEGSPEEHTLSAKLAQLIVDAGSEMNQHVDMAKEGIAEEAAKASGEPSAKEALEVYKARVIEQATGAGAINMLKPEDIEAAARKMYQEDSQKAAELAEQKLNDNPEQKVKNVQNKLRALPSDLKGSKPRYGYKDKLFELSFDDPRDLAAYTLSQAKENKAHSKFLDWYKQEHPGATENSIKEHAARVRNFIKSKAVNGNPEDGAITIPSQAKKTAYSVDDLPKPTYKVRSQYSEDKFGQPSASYSVNPEYKVYLKGIAKKQGLDFNSKEFGKFLVDHFADLDDEDFNKDLEAYFYPKALKDAGIHFEASNTVEGKQNPNFMAFMYNYLEKMPKELGMELEKRFAETLKVQKYMSGKSPSEPQLMYYAKAMYNHVDNLLSSGRWPSESHIFRSSQPNMWQPSKWQRQLLIERGVEERKNLKDAFGSNKKAAQAALLTHKKLSEARLAEFDAASRKLSSQENISDINNDISDLLTSTGDREKVEF